MPKKILSYLNGPRCDALRLVDHPEIPRVTERDGAGEIAGLVVEEVGVLRLARDLQKLTALDVSSLVERSVWQRPRKRLAGALPIHRFQIFLEGCHFVLRLPLRVLETAALAPLTLFVEAAEIPANLLRCRAGA